MMQDRDAEALEARQVEDALVLMHGLAHERRRDCEPHASARLRQRLGCVEAGPAAAPVGHEHGPADALGSADRVPGVDHCDACGSQELRPVRARSGRHDHAIGLAREWRVRGEPRIEADVHTGSPQAPLPVRGVARGRLAVRGRPAGERELTAERGGGLDQRHLCARAPSGDRGGHARRAPADHEHARAGLRHGARGMRASRPVRGFCRHEIGRPRW